MTYEEYIVEYRKCSRKELLNLNDRIFHGDDVSIDDNGSRAIQTLLVRENTYDVMNFVYQKKVDIVCIQTFAMLVKKVLRGGFPKENFALLLLDLPDNISDLDSLYDLAELHVYDFKFYISTNEYGKIEYLTQPNIQVPSIDILLYLRVLQNKFSLLKDNHSLINYNLLFDFTQLFIFLNNGVQNFFYCEAVENGNFEWDAKYSPCFIDLEFLRCLSEMFRNARHEHKKFNSDISLKYLILKFVYQCRFLSFWACLIVIDTFPLLDDKAKEVLDNLISYLLKNYANIYLYDIVIEGVAVKSDRINGRKSDANTTRLKIYFTHDDGKPALIRLDLPHLEHPYVHINVEGISGNQHFPLSRDAVSFEYDSVFDELCESLKNLDYYSSECYHSPASVDHVTFEDMQIRTAMFEYAPIVFEETITGRKSELSKNNSVESAREYLLTNISESLDFSAEGLQSLSSEEILTYADMLLN